MSDRIIKMSEISEPNSSTLLGPSNQKSKLTSGDRCAAKHQDQMAIFWRQTDNGAKKRRENGPFWRLFLRCWRQKWRNRLAVWTQHSWGFHLCVFSVSNKKEQSLSSAVISITRGLSTWVCGLCPEKKKIQNDATRHGWTHHQNLAGKWDPDRRIKCPIG